MNLSLFLNSLGPYNAAIMLINIGGCLCVISFLFEEELDSPSSLNGISLFLGDSSPEVFSFGP